MTKIEVEYIGIRFLLGERCFNTESSYVLYYPTGGKFGWANIEDIRIISKLEKVLEWLGQRERDVHERSE